MKLIVRNFLFFLLALLFLNFVFAFYLFASRVPLATNVLFAVTTVAWLFLILSSVRVEIDMKERGAKTSILLLFLIEFVFFCAGRFLFERFEWYASSAFMRMKMPELARGGEVLISVVLLGVIIGLFYRAIRKGVIISEKKWKIKKN